VHDPAEYARTAHGANGNGSGLSRFIAADESSAGLRLRDAARDAAHAMGYCQGAVMDTTERATRARRTKRGSGLVLALLLAAGAPVVSTVALQSTPAGAVGPPSITAYVANGTSPGSLDPINTTTKKAHTAIPLADQAQAVAITPNGATAYVVSLDDGNVTPVNLATGTPGTPIPVGSSPQNIAITPNGKAAYPTRATTR
jgi:DNA-binding beta-propeller fold protein YncE